MAKGGLATDVVAGGPHTWLVANHTDGERWTDNPHAWWQAAHTAGGLATHVAAGELATHVAAGGLATHVAAG